MGYCRVKFPPYFNFPSPINFPAPCNIYLIYITIKLAESLLSRSDLTTSPVPSPGTPQVFVSPDGGAFAAISGPPVTKVDKALP